MCIAIAKQAGIAIDEAILETCFDNNSDGAGFVVENTDGSFSLRKGFFTFKQFMDTFREHAQKKALIHFRIKTHGALNKYNCHPFKITDNVAFIHNGIIHKMESKSHQSDTIVFKNTVLIPIVHKYGEKALLDPLIQQLLSSYVNGNKLAFMIKGQQDFVILNKDLGNLSKEGIWFSNYSWQATKQFPLTPYQPYQDRAWSRELERKRTIPALIPSPIITPSPKGFTKKTEIPLLRSYKGEFAFGTLVRTTADSNHKVGTLNKGVLGQVQAVYNDYTMDVDFYSPWGEIEDISPWDLEIMDLGKNSDYQSMYGEHYD